MLWQDAWQNGEMITTGQSQAMMLVLAWTSIWQLPVLSSPSVDSRSRLSFGESRILADEMIHFYENKVDGEAPNIEAVHVI
jgi:hypothetical protein